VFLRVDENTSTIPVRFTQLTGALTLYVRGPTMDGGILGDILQKCRQLKRVRVERKDNDWNAPDTAWALTNPDELAQGLRNHASLQEFSLLGVTRSVDSVCEALGTLPQLSSVTLQADPHFAKQSTAAAALVSPRNLRLLLQTAGLQRLSVTGLFPETPAYTQVLHDAFVRDACTVHIFVHFSGGARQTVSRFSYFLRQVMDLNQRGRRRGGDDMFQLLRHVAKRRHYSVDAAYLLLRDNPWLMGGGRPPPPVSAGASGPRRTNKKSWKQKVQAAIGRLSCQTA